MRRTPLLLTVLGVALVAAWVARLSQRTESDRPASADPDAESGVEASARLHGRGEAVGPDAYDTAVPVEPAPEWLPEPVDLRDASQASAYLTSLLDEERVGWTHVGDVLASSPGPFSDAIQKRLLDAVTGEDRAAASRAVIRMRDGSLVADLLALYDSGRLEDGVRAGVLGVMVELEGADPDKVAEALATRLKHEPRRDRELLNAIALRRGAEAASVLIEYLRWSREQDPPVEFTMPNLDLVNDAAGRGVLLAELARESSTEVREALLRTAGQRGALAVASALIEMDGLERYERGHQARFAALAEIGGDDVAIYLVERGSREDELAMDAMQALAHLSTAGERGCAALREVLARSMAEPSRADELADARTPSAFSPDRRSAQLLRLLGRLRDPYAAPLMGRCLKAPSPRVRDAAVDGLGRLGRDARGQVGALITAYDNAGEDEAFRRAAVRALARVGGAGASDFLLRLQDARDLPEALREVVSAALGDVRRR